MRPADPARANALGVAARGTPQTIFLHNATSFACAACGVEFRHLGELVAHRRREHRSSVFEDWFQSSCACVALYRSRTDARVHFAAANFYGHPVGIGSTTICTHA